MTALLTGVLVAAVVALPAVGRLRAERLRLERLGPPPGGGGRTHRPHARRGQGHGRPDGALVVVLEALRRLGSTLRRRAGRPADGEADLVAGTAIVLGVVGAVLVSPVVGALLAGVVVGVPAWRRRTARRRLDSAVRSGLPDVVDLFRLAVGAGLSVHQCIDVVAPEAPEPIGAALREVRRRQALGVRLGDALEALDGLGDTARPLAAALTGAARYGTPLTSTLERVVADARVLRRRRAEEHARKLPVKLLFPLVMCVLPAFGLLAVVPLLAGSLPSLGDR